MEVPSESFKGELGIEEPVILCEPRILSFSGLYSKKASFGLNIPDLKIAKACKRVINL
jgi:hypothetical protein